MENTKTLHQQLNGWDGYSRKGEAVYDAIFEQEKNEMINLGLECKCGCYKSSDAKYCNYDHCRYD
jgi:hypothetical protein